MVLSVLEEISGKAEVLVLCVESAVNNADFYGCNPLVGLELLPSPWRVYSFKSPAESSIIVIYGKVITLLSEVEKVSELFT